jgi:hypothetical protein
MRRRKWVRVCAAGRGRFLWLTAAFRLLFQRSAHARSYRCSVPPKACSRRCGSPQAAAARSPCMRRASACACRPLALAHSSCCCCTGPHSGPWPSVQKRGTPAHSMALHGAGDAFCRNSTAHPVAPHPPRLRAAQAERGFVALPFAGRRRRLPSSSVVWRRRLRPWSHCRSFGPSRTARSSEVGGRRRSSLPLRCHSRPSQRVCRRTGMFRAACVRCGARHGVQWPTQCTAQHCHGCSSLSLVPSAGMAEAPAARSLGCRIPPVLGRLRPARRSS